MKGSTRPQRLNSSHIRSTNGSLSHESGNFQSRTTTPASFLANPAPTPTPDHPAFSRHVTVYDTVPIGVTNYSEWTREWLPRLAGSRAGRRSVATSHRPIGFAVRVNNSAVSTKGINSIMPSVLTFRGSAIKAQQKQEPGQRSSIETKDRTYMKSPGRLYTHSVFRRAATETEEEKPNDSRNSPEPDRPRSAVQRSIATPSMKSVPSNYCFPGERGEAAGPVNMLPDALLENYQEPERRKYFVISQAVMNNSSTRLPQSPRLSSASSSGRATEPPPPSPPKHLFTSYDSHTESQLQLFGVKKNPYTLNHGPTPRKGTLRHGHSWNIGEAKSDTDRQTDVTEMVVTPKNTSQTVLMKVTIKDGDTVNVGEVLTEANEDTSQET